VYILATYIRLVSLITVLDKLGYVSVPSKAEQIVSESIKKSFESLFGQAATAVMLNNLSSLYGLSEKELITNYDIFEKSLYEISSYGAKIILLHIKKEILIQAVESSLDSEITEQDIVNPDFDIGDILKKISYSEVVEFVHRIVAGMHIVFVYENEDTKYKVLAAFLDGSYRKNNTNTVDNAVTSTIKALISNKQTKFSHIDNILYYEDLLRIKKSEIIREIWDWINSFKNESNSEVLKKYNNKETITEHSIVSSSPSSPPNIRIVIEDALSFLVDNFRDEFVSIEEIIKKHISNFKSTSIFCAYKISNIISGYNDIDEKTIMRIVKSHSYVILENPPLIYRTTKS
jgi:hypothetical protein